MNMNDEDDMERMPLTFENIQPMTFQNNTPSAEYFTGQQLSQTHHIGQPLTHQHNSEYPYRAPNQWQNPRVHIQHNHLSLEFPPASVRSSASNSFRSSNNSIFSHHWRGSVASTSTTWSTYSESSKEHNVSQAQRMLSANSTTTYEDVNAPTVPAHERAPSSAANENRQHQNSLVKEHFSTCVSRTKRPRRSSKEPRYWCTSCKEGFREKYDWKRHEETYQERSDLYECELCKKTYFLDKDFIHHHRESHRCKTCVENQHVRTARRNRKMRTGWGCGFCIRFDNGWSERCSHVAGHFEKGATIANWNQTNVILSLLQRPSLRREWDRRVDTKHPYFGWSHQQAGRAEGYPDSDCAPKLQDILEFLTPDQDVSAIIEYAYQLGHDSNKELSEYMQPISSQVNQQSKKQPSDSFYSSIPDKDLPELPPPVPPKDSNGPGHQSTSTDHSITSEFVWSGLIETIPEDDYLPDHNPMDLRGLDLGDFDMHMDTNFQHF